MNKQQNNMYQLDLVNEKEFSRDKSSAKAPRTTEFSVFHKSSFECDYKLSSGLSVYRRECPIYYSHLCHIVDSTSNDLNVGSMHYSLKCTCQIC